MKKRMFVMASLLLAVALLCSCGKKKPSPQPQLLTDFSQRELSFQFSAHPSDSLRLSAEGAALVLDTLEAIQPDYPYQNLYELEEVKSRLNFDASVAQHGGSISRPLTGEKLYEQVTKNNTAFLEDKPFNLKSVDPDYVSKLCEFIVQIILTMEEKYPDLDWNRIYCNLSNLKILYNVGTFSYAQVNENMVLALSETNTGILLRMEGDDGFTRVLVHEIMHIMQIGCLCENIENSVRRAGISMYWDDFPMNTTDWTWMVEGSAERQMCNLTGGEAVSYQYKMDYLCSMTTSVLLRDSVQADTMESLCFYDDPELLFEVFGCETQAQREELLNMMITLQILQMQPDYFHSVLKEQTGIDLKNDSDAMDQFSYSLKPDICISLAKEFYENLTLFLRSIELSCNDLFFLINFFEGHIHPHLRYTAEGTEEINRSFMDSYRELRGALFTALEADNPGMDLTALYEAYDITAVGTDLLNAELYMLSEEKRNFLAERAQWQKDLLILGTKIPN
ncbi:MAG: hypothetical protein IKT58_05570 [Oscillospiraceae bacterium]|nr:hypothetical protein [Oscillospiraceae bacterium]